MAAGDAGCRLRLFRRGRRWLARHSDRERHGLAQRRQGGRHTISLHTTAALYRNQHDGTFADITKGSGLDFEAHSMGVAVGDYDNDGLDDVYITALEGDRLFHNEGSGHFRDVTAEAGIHNVSFGASAAWLDYDLDGKLDLFVANYVQWTPQGDLWCSMDGSTKSYCTPESYKGTSSKLYRNLGGGKFADVTQQAGLGDPTAKSLGVVTFDYDGDGWTDLFIANDTQPNKLYHNVKGQFQEVGIGGGSGLRRRRRRARRHGRGRGRLRPVRTAALDRRKLFQSNDGPLSQ